MKAKKLFIIFIVAAFICNGNMALFAQNEPEMPSMPDMGAGEETAPVTSSQPPAQTAKPVGKTTIESTSTGPVVTKAEVAEGTQEGHVTLIFKNANIRTVLHTLSQKSGVNIVASSDVEGEVSIRLVDVHWKTALEVILKNQGLAYEQVGNIIRVITLANVADEELQNQLFVINYSRAKDIAEAIEDTLTERGKVKYDERTNTVIITDIPTNLFKIKEVVERLDRRTPQVRIEAKIIETRLDKDENLGIDWTLQASVGGSSRKTTFPFERQRVPLSRKEGDLVRGGLGYYLPLGDSTSSFPTITAPAFPFIGADDFEFGTLDFTDFSAVLEILKSRTDTKVVANPTIVTLDNKEAKVVVGDVYNFPTYERNETTGNMEVTGFESKDIGVILTVIPHVNEAGDIVVELTPEISAAYSTFDNFGTADNPIYAPRFSTRTANTQVMVKDGQTIAIGGLTKETQSKYDKKVPILGDIPFLGELFKKTEDAIDTTDMLIFVTVTLVGESVDDKVLMEKSEKKAIHGEEIEFKKIDKEWTGPKKEDEEELETSTNS